MAITTDQESRQDFIKTRTSPRSFYALGSTFMYKNWVYGLAGRIIERVSKELYGSFLHNRIFSPLGLERTFVEVVPKADNIASSYVYSGAETLYPVKKPEFGSGTIMASACAIKSCISDLLEFYKEFMNAAEDQACRSSTSTLGSPFK